MLRSGRNVQRATYDINDHLTIWQRFAARSPSFRPRSGLETGNHLVLGLRKVGVEQGRRQLRISGTYGVGDMGVPLEESSVKVLRVVHERVGKAKLSQDFGDQAVEALTPSQRDQRLVEADAGSCHASPLLLDDRCLTVLNRSLHGAQPGRANDLDALQRGALDDATDAVKIGDVLHAQLTNEDAPAELVNEQPLPDQQLQRFAQRAARDPERFLHPFLGEFCPRQQLTVDDTGPHRVRDPARGAIPSDARPRRMQTPIIENPDVIHFGSRPSRGARFERNCPRGKASVHPPLLFRQTICTVAALGQDGGMVSVQRELRVGIDIGGTFTDLCVLDRDGIVAVGKTLTTHTEPAAGVESVLQETLNEHHLDPGDVGGVVHGTTLVTNALIERRGARTALVTTEGFRDVVEMRREHRYELYDLGLELPRPLVPRWLRIGVPERVLADGTVDTPLDTDRLARVSLELAEAGVEAVAVCFLHSHTNPMHEMLAREVINKTAPGLRVALSSEVNPEIREYERSTTTLANVYVQGLVEDYLNDLRARLLNLGVKPHPRIMLSNGGVATIDTARRFPIRMLESGPAGGALGAVTFGRHAERPDQLAFDMGGTTAKVCIIENGQPLVSHTFEVDRIYRLKAGSGIPVRAPVIDMIEIGAGGGSVARVDPLGLLTVGPDSAGSEPGPVSYGRGGEACTVTDADVVLGYLASDDFLGGAMRLDADAAARSITEQIAEPMGITLAEAAWGIHATVNENMANAARVHAVERGQDPSRLPMFVMGGNGPLHGPGVAYALGCETVIAPPAAGVLSALGFLSAPLSIDFAQSWRTELDTTTVGAAAKSFADLECQGEEVLRESGVSSDAIEHVRSLEMRFVGQGSEIEVPVPAVREGWHDEVRRSFGQRYEERFGTVMPHGLEVEIMTWRLTSRGPDPDARLRLAPTSTTTDARIGTRQVYFSEAQEYTETAVYNRYMMRTGAAVEGPALIQERESTLVVGPSMRCEVSSDGSILLHLRGEK